MLSEFLSKNKKEILELCRRKVLLASESKPTSDLLNQGIPIFYDELIGVLERTATTAGTSNDSGENPMTTNNISEGDAAMHGKESLRLGYSISQVVHAYGAVCQSITETAQSKSCSITALEFHNMNLSLDLAIAEAVTEYEKAATDNTSRSEVGRLASLIHEIGNSLVSATIAAEMIQKGHVGNAGSTSTLMSDSLGRMRYILNNSLAEIRLRGHAVEQTPIRLMDIISEVEAATIAKENVNGIRIEIHVDPTIYLTTDRHLILSVLSNVMSNAMKFTKKNGNVSVSSKVFGKRILIEVEDECGGLPGGKTENLFKPFARRSSDKAEIGMGLALSRQTIALIHGKLTVRDVPGKGCIFTIDLPNF